MAVDTGSQLGATCRVDVAIAAGHDHQHWIFHTSVGAELGIVRFLIDHAVMPAEVLLEVDAVCRPMILVFDEFPFHDFLSVPIPRFAVAARPPTRSMAAGG